jgi:hypothetical protein
MGITANYRCIPPADFAEMQISPELAKTLLDVDNIDFSLGKEWHALDFLLSGKDTQAPPPYCNVVMGGTPTKFEATYGFIRYLSPEEVKAVSELLSSISVDKLRRRFDTDAFNAARIYPLNDKWDEEDIEDLLEIYPELVEFFQEASQYGDIVLLSSD